MNCNISTGLKGKQICVSIVLCYNVCVFSMDVFFFVGWIVWLQSTGPFNRCLFLFLFILFGILVSFPWLIRIKSTNAIKLDKHFNRIKKIPNHYAIRKRRENSKTKINFRLFDFICLAAFHFMLSLSISHSSFLYCIFLAVRAYVCVAVDHLTNVLELGSS